MKNALEYRIEILALSIFCFSIYLLFFYKSPPSVIGNDYLIDTKEIIVSSTQNGIINHIQDETRIQYILDKLEFTKLKAGHGMDSPTRYQANFIGSNSTFTLYFDDRISEMTFYPEIQFSNWDKWNISAGTIVPVYRTVIDVEKFNLLVAGE